MKRFLIFLGVVMFILGGFVVAGATTFEPAPDNDLGDLSHGSFYVWGINYDIPEGQTIVSASITFDQIQNWNSSDNDLWLHLLDNPWKYQGTYQHHDYQSGQVDQFNSWPFNNVEGIELNQWEDLPATPQDITYVLDSQELAALNAYAADGFIAIGIDPDCHFFNNGVSMEVNAAPEPATMLLLGTGLIGLAGFRKKFKKA